MGLLASEDITMESFSPPTQVTLFDIQFLLDGNFLSCVGWGSHC